MDGESWALTPEILQKPQVNDGGGNDASCVGIKVRTDTTKLSDMVIASFGDGRNLIREGKMFIKDESKVASRLSGVKSKIDQEMRL